MTSAQHKVDMYNLANERRKNGQPVWALKVRGVRAILNDDGWTLTEKRDKLVACIKGSRWYKQSDEFGDLREVIDELTDVGHPEIDWDDDYSAERHFNDCLSRVYDLADWDRVWIE